MSSFEPGGIYDKNVMYEGVTTSAGNVGGTTLIDTGLTQGTDYWKNMVVLILSGNSSKQSRRISGFTAATDTITVDTAFASIIASGTRFAILSLHTGNGIGDATAANQTLILTDTNAIVIDTAEIGAAGAGLTAVAQASVCTNTRLAELDAANLPTDVANVKIDTAAILIDTAEIGAAGAGLTTLGDARLANLDALISSRTKPADTQAAVTNLTNAPTSGDFTAAMKTSLNAATPASIVGAVGSVTGNVGGNVTGSVGSVVGDTNQTGDNYTRLGAPTGASISADIAAVKAETDLLVATDNNYSTTASLNFTTEKTVFEIAVDTRYQILSPWIDITPFTNTATITFQFYRSAAAAGATYRKAGDAITKVVGTDNPIIEFADWAHYGYTKVTAISNNGADTAVTVPFGYIKKPLE